MKRVHYLPGAPTPPTVQELQAAIDLTPYIVSHYPPENPVSRPRISVRYDPTVKGGQEYPRYAIVSEESLAWSGLTGGKRVWGQRHYELYVYPFVKWTSAMHYARLIAQNWFNHQPVVP